jgi:hypothetical protein
VPEISPITRKPWLVRIPIRRGLVQGPWWRNPVW